MTDKIYQEEILEHFKQPKNKKTIDNPDFSSGKYNPSCGDSIAITGKITNDTITELGFNGSGCVISQATASMLTQLCVGKTPQEVLALGKEDIQAMLGMQLGPTRIKCAILSLQALQDGLSKQLEQSKK